jgi:hypothetical protein
VLAVSLAACGGESFSGAKSDKEATANPVCPPRPARLTKAPRKRAAFDKPIRVDLTDASGGKASRVQITVKSVKTPAGIDDAFTKKGRFRPGGTDRFVAVNFSLKNRGKGRIEAANSVNEAFVIADGNGRAWLRADGEEKCSAISPSAASNAGSSSPEGDLDPGQKYNTTAVYVVPREARDLSWVGPGVRFPLKAR